MAQIPSGVVSARLKDLASGEVKELKPVANSGCLFADKFRHGGYDIGLRVQLTDRDTNGNPTLDADFFAPGETKPIRSKRCRAAHHTGRVLDPTVREWLYVFEFDNLRLPLLLIVTLEVNHTTNSIIVAAEPQGH